MAYTPANANGQNTSANSAPVVIASDQSPVGIQNELITFKDDFPGTTLDTSANGWTVRQASGTATTYSVANSILTINSGTTANDYIAFTSKQVFTTPMRMQVQLTVSAKTTNTNFYVELVNASGIAVANLGSLVATTGTSQIGWAMLGTTGPSVAHVVAQNQGVKATADTSTATNNYVSGYIVFEIEARGDAVDYAYRITESNTMSAGTVTRTRTIATPGENYYLQIRSVNGATAPASNTVLNVESVIMQDVTKTVTEISGGRGNASLTKALPVVLQTNPTVVLGSGTNAVGTVQPGNTANTTPWLMRQSSTTATQTSVTAATTSTTLLNSNANRREASIYNDSTAVLYVSFSGAASTTNYRLQIPANGYFEFPSPQCTGAVTGIWAAANGSARITEVV